MPRRMLLVVLCRLCPAAPGTPDSCALVCGVTFAGLHFGSPCFLLALKPRRMLLVVFVECVQQRQAHPTVAHLLGRRVKLDGLHFGSPCVLLALVPRRMLLVVLCGMCPAELGWGGT